MFVEVVERIRAQHPVSAMMIGDGALRSQVEQAIATKGLHGSITMCGVLPHDQVLKKMRDASVLVHTSRYEGQGYVFDEAFACGMAIASTPVGSALAYRTGMYPMDRWLIAEQSDGLAIHALDLLRAPTGAPFILHPIADTVAAYLALYGLR